MMKPILICVAALLGIVLFGCLGNSGTMAENIAVHTEPSPISLDIGPDGGNNMALVTLANNNPYPIHVQCFPPPGPSEAYLQETHGGAVNRTLLARPAFDCYDTDHMANSSRAAYPTVTIRPNEAHSFYVRAYQLGYIGLRTTNETFKTIPGTYDLELRLDVSCGFSIYCSNRHENMTVPVTVTVQPAGTEAER